MMDLQSKKTQGVPFSRQAMMQTGPETSIKPQPNPKEASELLHPQQPEVTKSLTYDVQKCTQKTMAGQGKEERRQARARRRQAGKEESGEEYEE